MQTENIIEITVTQQIHCIHAKQILHFVKVGHIRKFLFQQISDFYFES